MSHCTHELVLLGLLSCETETSPLSWTPNFHWKNFHPGDFFFLSPYFRLSVSTLEAALGACIVLGRGGRQGRRRLWTWQG